MTPFVTTINELSDVVLPALWRASWQGGLALLLVYVLCRAVRRFPAQAQCWLWRLAYLKLLIASLWIIPIELRWLPPPQVTAEVMPAAAAAEPPAQWEQSFEEAAFEDAGFVAPLPDSIEPVAASPKAVPRLHWRGWLLIAWVLGVTLLLANLLRHWIGVRRLLSRLAPVANEAVTQRLFEHCRQMQVRRPPEVRIAADVRSPFLVGLRQPVIVLPSSIVESCTADELDAVLTHELAHVKRRDLLWNWLPALAETVYFFHPLLWLTRREWRLSQEIATDELAVSASQIDVARYARSLVDVVSKSPHTAKSPHLAVALSEAYTQLARRMSAMQTFRPLTRRRRAVMAAAVLAISVVGLVPWKLAAQATETLPESSGDAQQGAAAQRTFVDGADDPLPEGAILRLGTSRLRQTWFVQGVAFTPDSRQLVSMGSGESIRFWDVQTGAPVRRFHTGHYDATNNVAFSPDGTKMASVGDQGWVRLWDMKTGNELSKTLGHQSNSKGERIHGVAFSPDGKVFVTAGFDSPVVVWNAETGAELRRLETGEDGSDARTVAFSPDGRFLASGTAKGVIFIWDLKQDSDPKIIRKAHGRQVMSLAFTPDGSLISGGYRDEQAANGETQPVSEIRVWDAESGERKRELKSFRQFFGWCPIALSQDRKILASAHRDEVVVWDMETFRVIHMFKSDSQQYGGLGHGVAISPDNRYVAAKASDKKVRMWSIETGQEVLSQEGSHKNSVRSIQIASDNRTVATAGGDATVRLWDASTGSLLRSLGTDGRSIRFLGFFPEGDKLAIGAEARDRETGKSTGEVRIARIADGKTLHRFEVSDQLWCGAVSPNGQLVAAGVGSPVLLDTGENGGQRIGPVIQVWNAHTGESVTDLKVDVGAQTEISFGPDGDSLWCVGWHRAITKWNLRTGDKILRHMLQKAHANNGQISLIGIRSCVAARTSRLVYGRPLTDVLGGQSGALGMLNLETGKVAWSQPDLPWWPTVFCFSADERRFATFLQAVSHSDANHRLTIYATDDGRELKSFELEDERAWSLAFSPDGSRLVSGMDDGDALVWDISDISRPVD